MPVNNEIPNVIGASVTANAVSPSDRLLEQPERFARTAPTHQFDSLFAEFETFRYRLMPVQTPDESALESARAALVSASPFKSEIYLPTARMPLLEQVRGLQRVHDLVQPHNLAVSTQRFDILRQVVRERGTKRIFIIGNGPSLKRTDLAMLKDEVTIGFNGIFLHETFTPTIYIVEDHLVAEDRVKEIHAYRCPVKIFPSYLGYCIEPQENTIFLNHRSRISYPVDTDFSADAGRISYTGGTVTYTGLQIAASLDVDEIILVGVDASYRVHNVERSDRYGTGVLTSKEDDTNHFDPRYFGKGYRWHDPNVHTMLQAYRKAREHGRDHGVRIVNASLGGELEVFPRVDFHQLFERERVFPRLAVLDFTSVNRLSATGIVKRNLLAGWPKSSQFHVSADEQARLIAFQSIPHDLYAQGLDEHSVWPAFRSLVEYDPQLLYLRPTLDRVQMTVFQVVCAAVLGKPWVVHYMDDWLEKARAVCTAEVAAAYRELMRYVFKGASQVLSISSKMSAHLQREFGLDAPRVHAIHNYTPASAVKSKRTIRNKGGERVLRYFGGLEPDMGLSTVLDVARQVAALNQADSAYRLRFEVVTSAYAIKCHTETFAPFAGIHLVPQYDDYADYLAALSTSDLNFVCYNFDDKSLSYVGYSLANKLPELLACGVPLLAIGHSDIGTIELLRSVGYPLVLSSPDFRIGPMLEQAFDPTQEQVEQQLAALAKLKDEFSEENNRCRLHNLLRVAASSEPSAGAPPMEALRTLVGSIPPGAKPSQDLDLLLRLPSVERGVLQLALQRVRAHGREWSVRDEVVQLAELIDMPTGLVAAEPALQARALAFLIASLGHERYRGVNDVVREWLRHSAHEHAAGQGEATSAVAQIRHAPTLHAQRESVDVVSSTTSEPGVSPDYSTALKCFREGDYATAMRMARQLHKAEPEFRWYGELVTACEKKLASAAQPCIELPDSEVTDCAAPAACPP